MPVPVCRFESCSGHLKRNPLFAERVVFFFRVFNVLIVYRVVNGLKNFSPYVQIIQAVVVPGRKNPVAEKDVADLLNRIDPDKCSGIS